MVNVEQKTKEARLEFACRYFDKKKLIRIEPNGFDLKTKKYSIPGGYMNCETYGEAFQVLNDNNFANGIFADLFLKDETIDEHLAAWEIPVHIITDKGKTICVVAGELYEKLCKKYPTDTYFTEKMLNDTINEI